MNTWLTARYQHTPALAALILITVLHTFLAEQLIITGLWEEVTGTDFFDADSNNFIYYLEWSLLIIFGGFWIMNAKRAMRWCIYAYCSYVTITLAVSVVGLVLTLTARKSSDAGFDLLWDALVVWTINVLIFAVWYWLLDGQTQQQAAGARHHFLFPQQANALPGWGNWQPRWFDFAFLAFSHSTAFSPTDTAALSGVAKLLIMIQASLSLVTLATIAARAVNVIN